MIPKPILIQDRIDTVLKIPI